jgi:hypothetical protein
MAGEWDVEKIRKGLTARAFMEWEAYFHLEPFGDFRADYRAASIREMVHNIAVAKKHRKPLEDFLLKFEEKAGGERKEVRSWQDLKAIFAQAALVHSVPAEELK